MPNAAASAYRFWYVIAEPADCGVWYNQRIV
jgi:hypothetical protein